MDWIYFSTMKCIQSSTCNQCAAISGNLKNGQPNTIHNYNYLDPNKDFSVVTIPIPSIITTCSDRVLEATSMMQPSVRERKMYPTGIARWMPGRVLRRPINSKVTATRISVVDVLTLQINSVHPRPCSTACIDLYF